jgi:uncharacterized membrane protein
MQGDTTVTTTTYHEPKKRTLYQHTPHPYKPQNVNLLFETEKAAAGFNKRVAILMTKFFSAMPTFWLIMLWIVLWIATNATILHFDPLPWPLLLALASVPQLPLMIVIMVGQGLLGRQQELQSEEQYNTTMKTYHDIEQIMAHLSIQDEELLRQTHMMIHLLKVSGISPEQVLADLPTKATTISNGISAPTPPAIS